MTVPSPFSEAPSFVSAAPPLLAALRAGTKAAHLRVEAAPSMARLLAPDLSAAAYIAALRAMRSFHAAIGQRVTPFLQNARLRAPDPGVSAALEADLAWFGVKLRPQAGAQPPIKTLPGALGALYVLEGSALGGRVIGRAVAASLSVSPGRGGSFYCGLTADRARDRWRSFCADLEREGAAMDPSGLAGAVAGANETFRTLERLLQGRRSAVRPSVVHPFGVAPPRMAGSAPRAVPAAMSDPAHAAARTTI